MIKKEPLPVTLGDESKHSTWGANVAAASVELLAGAAALLLPAVGQHVEVHGPRRQVLDHDSLVRAVVLVGAVDAARVPVGPEDVLIVEGHGERVDGCAHDHLSIGPGEGAALDLLSEKHTHESKHTHAPTKQS